LRLAPCPLWVDARLASSQSYVTRKGQVYIGTGFATPHRSTPAHSPDESLPTGRKLRAVCAHNGVRQQRDRCVNDTCCLVTPKEGRFFMMIFVRLLISLYVARSSVRGMTASHSRTLDSCLSCQPPASHNRVNRRLMLMRRSPVDYHIRKERDTASLRVPGGKYVGQYLKRGARADAPSDIGTAWVCDAAPKSKLTATVSAPPSPQGCSFWAHKTCKLSPR
jgi:hypothetical protein